VVASPTGGDPAEPATPKPEGATGGPILDAETVLAKLVAFYKLDPQRVLELPQYLIGILMSKQAALEAELLREQVTAAIAPHLEDDDRRELMEGLADAVEPIQPRRPDPVMPTVHDPEKAREWFASIGAKVKVVSAP
jgi:hypothetical protein